jgi:hypothetical protein
MSKQELIAGVIVDETPCGSVPYISKASFLPDDLLEDIVGVAIRYFPGLSSLSRRVDEESGKVTYLIEMDLEKLRDPEFQKYAEPAFRKRFGF